MQQAATAATVLGTFDAVYASSLQRAADTAAIIADALGIGPVQLLDDLMENAFGPWQGLTIGEIENGWPGFLSDHKRPEGAETIDAVFDRGLRALRTIAARHPGQQALVITHAGILRTLHRELLLTTRGDDRASLRFGNLSGCWFHVDEDGRVHVGDVVSVLDPHAVTRATARDTL